MVGAYVPLGHGSNQVTWSLTHMQHLRASLTLMHRPSEPSSPVRSILSNSWSHLWRPTFYFLFTFLGEIRILTSASKIKSRVNSSSLPSSPTFNIGRSPGSRTSIVVFWTLGRVACRYYTQQVVLLDLFPILQGKTWEMLGDIIRVFWASVMLRSDLSLPEQSMRKLTNKVTWCDKLGGPKYQV